MTRVPTIVAGVLLVGAIACQSADPAEAPAGPSLGKSAAFPYKTSLPSPPEGIAIGNGTTVYVGNLSANANGLPAIYQGDLKAGGLTELLANDAKPVLGLAHDPRSGYLFAARGNSGRGTVIDVKTGTVVEEFPFQTTGTFINDVVVTKDAAWFTDSSRPLLYRVPLDAAGRLAGGFTAVTLSGDWVQAASGHCGTGQVPYSLPALNANGIEATPDGKNLLVNNLRVGTLYRVDPATGVATRVTLDTGDVCFADGMLLAGKTLYVVQNLLSRVAVVELAPDHRSGVISRHILHTHPITTIGRHGTALYAVTAGFGFLTAFGQPYEMVRLGM